MTLPTLRARVAAYLIARGGKLRRGISEFDAFLEWWDIPDPRGGWSGIIVEFLPTIGTLNVYAEVPIAASEPEAILSHLFV